MLHIELVLELIIRLKLTSRDIFDNIIGMGNGDDGFSTLLNTLQVVMFGVNLYRNNSMDQIRRMVDDYSRYINIGIEW